MARHTVAAALHSAGVAGDCIDEVQVALSEACTNVIRHAGDGPSYDVLINVQDGQLSMEVLDLGRGFGHRPAGPGPTGGELAEDGRGLTLMRALTDQASFDTVTGGG